MVIYECGNVARNDVTCSNLKTTCLITTTSSNALCHSSRNLVTNCDSNRRKKEYAFMYPNFGCASFMFKG